MRWVKFVGFRLVISLLVVAALSFLLVYLPITSAKRQVTAYANQMQASLSGIINLKGQLEEVPGPETVKIGTQGNARAYATQLGLLKTTAPPLPQVPKPLFNPYREASVVTLNELIRDSRYQQAVKSSSDILAESQAAVNHQADTMRAVATLLTYDPAADLKGDAATLQGKLEAMKLGLTLARERIDKSTDQLGFKAELLKLIDELESERSSLFESLSGGPQDPAAFITKVQSTQTAIISNRQELWRRQLPLTQVKLRTAQSQLAPLVSRLRDLRS
jgi:hypothetical protein